MNRTLLIIFFLCLTSGCFAETLPIKCTVATGDDAVHLSGRTDEPAIRICKNSVRSSLELHRLSHVWRSRFGACHFLEENEEYVKDRTYPRMPESTEAFKMNPTKFLLYTSFGPVCAFQDSSEYFPVLSPISEQNIDAIRKMWQHLNTSNAEFLKFASEFDKSTGGASLKWRRNTLQIRFLDVVVGHAAGWQRLFGRKKTDYILGFKDGCCELYTATLDLGSDGAIIKSVVSAVQ